jgi:signal transduction histidine kinase
MENFLISILFSFSALLGIQSLPDNNGIWVVEKEWEKNDYTWTFKASTQKINELCSSPDQYLVFPQVVHGIHSVFADDKLIYQSGDKSFQQTTSFYQRPSISCKFLSKSASLSWEVVTYSKYFARVDNFPVVKNTDKLYFFLDVIVNSVAAGGLLILSCFSLFIFVGRIETKYVLSLFAASVAFASYSAFVTADTFGLNLTMLTAHKIADVSVWLGSLFYILFFRSFKHLGKIEFYSFIFAFTLGQALIIGGTNADVVQLGTTIPIPFAFVCLISFLVHTINSGVENGFNKYRVLGIISSALFVVFGINDLLHITGLVSSFMVMPIGSVGGLFFLAAAANQNIESTYNERDDLVKNLQEKVDAQTKSLQEALMQVKKSQADLVQSARLASLGTLSAGIAHEINNSINFINGAVIPLERKVMKSIPVEDQVMVTKLFGAIKQGTSLTVDIVRSLRNFTGLNQAKIKDVSVKTIVTSVLTILKSKLSNISVLVDIDESLTFTCYQVGINQVFMNIITNAIDVLPEKNPEIKISAVVENANLVIRIKDNGCGMSEEVRARIFEPFYTTKEVGKGTGLGLHIVFKEVEKHNGTITVNSSIGSGTEFVIAMPVEQNVIVGAA